MSTGIRMVSGSPSCASVVGESASSLRSIACRSAAMRRILSRALTTPCSSVDRESGRDRLRRGLEFSGACVSDFDFELPDELIAQEARRAAHRGCSSCDRDGESCRAMRSIRDLPRFLQPGDLLVAQQHRVFAARLLGRAIRVAAPSSACCCAGRRRRDVVGGADAPGPEAEARGARAVRGRRRRADGGGPRAAVLRPPHDPARGRRRPPTSTRSSTRWATCRCRRTSSVPTRSADRERYQTVFAASARFGRGADRRAPFHAGAPRGARRRAACERAEVTLHVGYGTFKPVADRDGGSARRRSGAVRDHRRRRPRRSTGRSTSGRRVDRRRHHDDARARGRRRPRRRPGPRRRAPRRRSSSIPASISRSSPGCSPTSICRSHRC